ncbi:hypothetical protein QE412_003461 [Microbacterium trichothecenolyticum]|uniref:Uncharacterized protein n=1 Tax=Microbacterium trichothecenolyticum TaxID=69370 RepID=A0ABU0TYZ8_MICTR|nr:hypothetical protein [Microbacterium trichothecenolyticum]
MAALSLEGVHAAGVEEREQLVKIATVGAAGVLGGEREEPFACEAAVPFGVGRAVGGERRHTHMITDIIVCV